MAGSIAGGNTEDASGRCRCRPERSGSMAGFLVKGFSGRVRPDRMSSDSGYLGRRTERPRTTFVPTSVPLGGLSKDRFAPNGPTHMGSYRTPAKPNLSLTSLTSPTRPTCPTKPTSNNKKPPAHPRGAVFSLEELALEVPKGRG